MISGRVYGMMGTSLSSVWKLRGLFLDRARCWFSVEVFDGGADGEFCLRSCTSKLLA
jgi:hypothetical protein